MINIFFMFYRRKGKVYGRVRLGIGRGRWYGLVCLWVDVFFVFLIFIDFKKLVESWRL